MRCVQFVGLQGSDMSARIERFCYMSNVEKSHLCVWGGGGGGVQVSGLTVFPALI